MKTEIDLIALLVEFGALTAGIISITEITHKYVRKYIPMPVDLYALLLGVLLSMLMHIAGFFTLPGVALWERLLGAAILGLIATATSNKLHDWTVKPAKTKTISVLESFRQPKG